MGDRRATADGPAGSCWLTFERWTKQAARVGEVRGRYSRAAWLPVIGPTAWLIWGAIADGLQRTGRLECSLDDLGHLWGYAPEDVSWALLQLTRYGLALPTGDDGWQVTTGCSPLPERLLPTAPESVQAVHRRRAPGWATRQRTWPRTPAVAWLRRVLPHPDPARADTPVRPTEQGATSVRRSDVIVLVGAALAVAIIILVTLHVLDRRARPETDGARARRVAEALVDTTITPPACRRPEPLVRLSAATGPRVSPGPSPG